MKIKTTFVWAVIAVAVLSIVKMFAGSSSSVDGDLMYSVCDDNSVVVTSACPAGFKRVTTDRVATDRVIMAFGLARDNSNGASAAISRCGVTVKRNGFVRIALAGCLDFARGLLRQIRKYAIIQTFPKRKRSLLVG